MGHLGRKEWRVGRVRSIHDNIITHIDTYILDKCFSGTIFRLSLQKSYSDTAHLVGLAVSHNKFVLLVVELCTLVLSLYGYI